MKTLKPMQGIKTQTAFEMFYGAKPSLRGQTITGKRVMVGYGNDKIDRKFDYIDLSKKRRMYFLSGDLSENEIELKKKEIERAEKLWHEGFYIEISEGTNDINIPIGEMIFIKQGLDYLANSDWNRSDVINLIMNQLGGKVFEWYGQISDTGKEIDILPYMAISVEPKFEDKQFFMNQYSQFLIEKYVDTK
jgi:hypothetical protein